MSLKSSGYKLLAVTGLALVFIFVASVYLIGGSDSRLIVEDLKDAQVSDSNLISTSTQNISAAVVNVWCDDGWADVGGSGLMIGTEGRILTNYHIIPQNLNGEPVVDSCLVTVPDSKTGKIKEIYTAKPVVSSWSEEYDLATFSITGPYIDESGVKYGQDSAIFKTVAGCSNENPSLGDAVQVYGYPYSGGGGLYLTVVEGIVSAFPNDGFTIISARISEGNSGGLVVDENNCVVGMPLRLTQGSEENLGVVIPVSTLQKYLKNIKAQDINLSL